MNTRKRTRGTEDPFGRVYPEPVLSLSKWHGRRAQDRFTQMNTDSLTTKTPMAQIPLPLEIGRGTFDLSRNDWRKLDREPLMGDLRHSPCKISRSEPIYCPHFGYPEKRKTRSPSRVCQFISTPPSFFRSMPIL